MADSDDDQVDQWDSRESLKTASPKSSTAGKRKREEENHLETQGTRKRKRSKKPKDVDDEALDSTLNINHALGRMDSRLLADHIAQRTRRFQPDLSAVEVENCYIPEKAIINTTSWDQSRTADYLATFAERFAGSRRQKKGQKLADAPADKGSPHTLVVTGAGLRAADLTRALRKYQTKDALVAKLFAKHIKLKEAVEMVQKSRINIGVGTPQRIFDLLEYGALSSSKLERIIIDASHIDQKKRGILDMKETQVPLVQLLTRPELKEKYGNSDKSVQLIFF